jgi:hypothetical protein
MKIETIVKTHAGNIVKYANNVKVVYNADAIGEVSDADGAYLVDRYPGQIFPAGKVVIPDPPLSSSKTPVDGSEAELLKDKLAKANLLINDYKAQTNQAKENERVWRMKCQELMDQVARLQNNLGATDKAEEKPMGRTKPPVEVDVDETEALKEKLTVKSVKELQIIAEELKLPVDEYRKLTKNKLVDYLIEKTTNAQS